MSNKEGNIVCAELGIPGVITVTDNPEYCHSKMTLIAIAQEKTRAKVRDEWDGSKKIVEWAEVVRPKFVFREDEESTVAQAIRQKEYAERVMARAENEKNKAIQACDKAEKKAAEADDRADRLFSDLKKIKDELRSARSQNQVMEKDLAKIRQSLGEIRMKEILAAVD